MPEQQRNLWSKFHELIWSDDSKDSELNKKLLRYANLKPHQ